MISSKRLSRASVLRLELYLEVVEQLQKEGRAHITSTDIGRALGMTAAKVRQDLFRLGTDGRPKVGYEINHLAGLLRGVFNLEDTKAICLIGFGNLGRALAGSNIWGKAGFRLAAIFDKDPEVIGTELDGIRVRSIAEIFGVVKAEGIEAGVIAVPAISAQETADLLVTAGAKGIWNFSPIKLQAPSHVAVENQSLSWGLITLSHSMLQLVERQK